MGLVMRKPVFGVSDKMRFKPASSATETSQKIEIALEASLDMIVSNTPITKVLIRQRRCAGWSVPLLFTNNGRQVFSRRCPDYTKNNKTLKQSIETLIIEPRHEISNNLVYATSKGSDQPAHTLSLIRAFANHLIFYEC